MNTLQKTSAQMRQLVQTLMPGGFYDAAGQLAPEFRGEVPLRLMYALRDARVQRWQLEALTLALRDAGEAAPLDGDAPLDAAHRKALDDIRAEDSLPVAFKGLLDAVAPRLRQQKDLVAFYGVMNNVVAKWDTMAALLHKDANAA